MTIPDISNVPEIPNIDVLRELIAATPVSRGHKKLLSALKERYPALLAWRVSDFKETWYSPGRQLLDSQGAVIAEDFSSWLKKELDDADGMAGKVWDKHHAAGYLRTEDEGHTVFAAAPIGPALDDIIEMRIGCVDVTKARGAFSKSRPFESEGSISLHHPNEPADSTWSPPQHPRYELRQMHNIARMLDAAERLELQRRSVVARDQRILVTDIIDDGSRPSVTAEKTVLELDPDYLKRPLRERRFLLDWAASTAAIEVPILQHWAFAVADYTHKDVRSVEITPRPLSWAPEIKWKRDRSVFKLMEMLERFDRKAGYPMAWFFHAVYGNRIGSWAIRDVAEGLHKRKIALPARDTAVVLRWAENEYAF